MLYYGLFTSLNSVIIIENPGLMDVCEKLFTSLILFFNLQLGTGLSILISKRNPSLVTTFSLLSCGYILSSYREVWLLCML